MSYNNAVANVNMLQEIEQRPYFLGRLTEAQLAEERKKAKIKGKLEGKLEAAKKMLSLGLPIDIISKSVELDIEIIRSLKP
jgi:predicted transposase/invertase (TIGR01784 family)